MQTLSWQPDLGQRSGSRYRAIADALEADIASGRVATGTRLPTHRALASALGVTVGTVTRAYGEAERRGLVDATVGRGTYVRGHRGGNPTLGPETEADSAAFPSLSPAPRPRGAARELPGDGVSDSVIDLSANYPVGTYFYDALAPALNAMTDANRINEIANYQAAVGHPDHREAGAAWLARFGLPVERDSIAVTNGCQGGLSITLDALTHPGDAILVEPLAWPGIHAIAEQRGLRVGAVAMDGEGIEPEALREAAKRHDARVAVCMPTLQNPTNGTMSEQRRRDILGVAAELGLTIVEDDIYGFLTDAPQSPLAALAPEHAVYVTSLSKCVAPGLRLGYVAAPRHLIPRLATAQRAASITAGSVAAEMASILVRNGHAATLAAQQHREARTRQDLARRILPHGSYLSAPGSFHLWLKLPANWPGPSFLRAAWSRGVALTPGHAFTPDAHEPGAVRLCLCAVSSMASLEAGLNTVAALMTENPMPTVPPV